jgi:Pvc16 N-terminal domain
MSDALALSAVTSVLQTCLGLVYTASPLGTVDVSAVAPDIVQNELGTGSDSPMRVNLFLHQVTPNPAWRNIDMPSLDSGGATRLKNPPLALDLHYLLTAYAGGDTEAEALLGYGILMLHENPILPRALINTILGSLPHTHPLYNPLKTTGLDTQIEMIKISPATLGREELAWLWTALKADYRPTFPFQVSVVLMRNPNPTVFSLPVLVRNLVVQPGPPAELLAVDPPNDQAAAVPGDTITVTGVSLSGASKVSLVNPKTNVTYAPFTPGTLKDTYFSFTVPEDPANLPVGICEISLLFEDTSGNIIQHTNTVTTAIAAKILATPKPSASVSGSETLITLSCDPQVLSTQSVFLVVGPNAIAAQPFTGSTAALSFRLPSALAPGTYAARLQVDGVPTPAAASWTFTPPNTLVQAP